MRPLKSYCTLHSSIVNATHKSVYTSVDMVIIDKDFNSIIKLNITQIGDIITTYSSESFHKFSDNLVRDIVFAQTSAKYYES